MNLLNWAEQYGISLEVHPSGAIVVNFDLVRKKGPDCSWDLHHLEDYVVDSSSSASVIWLVKRVIPLQPRQQIKLEDWETAKHGFSSLEEFKKFFGV